MKFQPVPKGWDTAQGWAKRENLSLNHCRKLLTELVREGLWQQRRWPVRSADGVIRPAMIYRRKCGGEA